MQGTEGDLLSGCSQDLGGGASLGQQGWSGAEGGLGEHSSRWLQRLKGKGVGQSP